MKVKLRLKSASQPIEFDAVSTYEKGSFFVVQVIEAEEVPAAAISGIRLREKAVKYPIADIFSVSEEYGYHDPRGPA